jgi:hypothetical protein
MRKVLAVLLLSPALAFAQNGVILPPGSNTLKSIHCNGTPGLGIYCPSTGTMWIGDESLGFLCTSGSGCTLKSSTFAIEGTTDDAYEAIFSFTDPTADRTFTFQDESGYVFVSTTSNIAGAANTVQLGSGAFVYEGATADTSESTVRVIDPTADRAIYFADESGHLSVNPLLRADAAIQFGSPVMPDAGTDGRFDVTTGSATLTIGIYGGAGAGLTGPTVQHSDYPITIHGLAYFRPAEDGAITRGHYLLMSATDGCVADSAAVSTDGLNLGLSLYSEPVSNTINHAGCTGGAGCVNTALDTPNAGPAGQITLAADVAAAGWTVGQPVIYWNSGGTSIAGLTDGAVYWLASVATTNVTLSATKGGAVVVPTTQGDDATQYLQRLPLGIVSIR